MDAAGETPIFIGPTDLGWCSERNFPADLRGHYLWLAVRLEYLGMCVVPPVTFLVTFSIRYLANFREQQLGAMGSTKERELMSRWAIESAAGGIARRFTVSTNCWG